MSVCEHGRIRGLKLCGICNPPTPASITIYSTPRKSLRDIRGELADQLNRGMEVSRDRLAEVVKDLDEYIAVIETR